MRKFTWIRAMKNHPLAALSAGLILGTLLSSLSVSASEPSPEELAREFGLPLEDGEDFGPNFQFSKDMPQTRVIRPENYKDFPLVVDVFRRSYKKPVLGEFRDEYILALVPNADTMTEEQARTLAKKRFADLAQKEFAIVSMNGVPVKANIISTGLEQYVEQIVKDADGNPVIDPATGRPVTKKSFKTTPPGAYRLDAFAYTKKIKAEDGTVERKLVANPWLRSRTYGNSQMFWGLWIKGGYLIHSTPHYGELGRPASMGCIRQSFPDAMELFTHLVEENMSAMIRIHKLGSSAAVARARELVFDVGYTPEAGSLPPMDITKDMNWLLTQLAVNWTRIRATVGYYGKEVEILGHAWIDATTGKPTPTYWPMCGLKDSGVDCFKPWYVRKPTNSVN